MTRDVKQLLWLGASVLVLAGGQGLISAKPVQPVLAQQDPEVDPTCWALTDLVEAGCDDCSLGHDVAPHHGVDCGQCKVGYEFSVICPEQQASTGGAIFLNCGRTDNAGLDCPSGGLAISLFAACSTCQWSNPWP